MGTANDSRFTPDHAMMIDTACLHSGARCQRSDYRTKLFVDDFYQCLMYRPDCKYAAPFGTSCLCISPHRPEYSIWESAADDEHMWRMA